jgi:hypothetical protein
LNHQTITIARQADRTSKGRKGKKQTKTRRVRTVDIEPHVPPLVTWLVEHPEGKAGRLLHMPRPRTAPISLWRDLRTVGVTQQSLHIEHDSTRRAIVFHDLRDTGLTHMAVRGDSPILIQWAGGHTDFKTTQGYIERGQTERRRVGDPLPPLPESLFRIAPKTPRAIDDAPSSLESLAILRPQRELKPKKWHFVSRRCRSSFVDRLRESQCFRPNVQSSRVHCIPLQSTEFLETILETSA